jgi:hypothetical protein
MVSAKDCDAETRKTTRQTAMNKATRRMLNLVNEGEVVALLGAELASRLSNCGSMDWVISSLDEIICVP